MVALFLDKDSAFMTSKVIMPQLGESVVEGTVSRWLKQQGQAIRQYEPLLEVSTDKVDTEIPSPAGGVLLQIYVGEGQTVAAGTLLAMIGEPGEQPQTDEPPARIATSNGSTHHEAQISHVTSVVARMVAEHKLDLSAIKGSGSGGRVTKKDVEAYLAGGHTAAVAEPPTPQIAVKTAPEPKPAPPAPRAPERLHPVEPIPQAASGELVGLTNMRRTIAEHMSHSRQTAPHVTTVFEVDMSAAIAHREANKDAFAAKGVNLTLTAYFAAASVTALQAHPAINAEWRDDGIFHYTAQHIGMAVALDDGLIVPVIKNAQDLNLLGMARTVNDLASRARAKQLKPDEVQGGTFTISNHGVGGSLFATPIIHQPQAAILGVGVIEKRVKVINDAIAIRPLCYISLTFDHRVTDGAQADAFMLTLKNALENWA
jgi:2-oxoisovalerate dehydrogenase E2 component (dihydrolipoyl transacylase)